MDQQTFALMMSQIMVMLTNLNPRSDQTERMFNRLEGIVATYQSRVEKLYEVRSTKFSPLLGGQLTPQPQTHVQHQ